MSRRRITLRLSRQEADVLQIALMCFHPQDVTGRTYRGMRVERWTGAEIHGEVQLAAAAERIERKLLGEIAKWTGNSR
jgi:hypothetical protein